MVRGMVDDRRLFDKSAVFLPLRHSYPMALLDLVKLVERVPALLLPILKLALRVLGHKHARRLAPALYPPGTRVTSSSSL